MISCYAAAIRHPSRARCASGTYENTKGRRGTDVFSTSPGKIGDDELFRPCGACILRKNMNANAGTCGQRSRCIIRVRVQSRREIFPRPPDDEEGSLARSLVEKPREISPAARVIVIPVRFRKHSKKNCQSYDWDERDARARGQAMCALRRRRVRLFARRNDSSVTSCPRSNFTGSHNPSLSVSVIELRRLTDVASRARRGCGGGERGEARWDEEERTRRGTR